MQTDGFKSLVAWQKSLDLVEEVYRITRTFPKFEQFGLASQLQRAAVSILANIAEGYGRSSKNEFRHFLTISLGSLAEVEALLIVAVRLDYLSETEQATIDGLRNDVGKLLTGLKRSL